MVNDHLAYDGHLPKVSSRRVCRGRGEGREDMERERYGGKGGNRGKVVSVG